jgi:hypothetical protein
MEKSPVEKLVEEITDFVNTYSLRGDAFNEAMSREHRTLQQSFTRLCLKWIEYVASDEYGFDGRNEASHDICKTMIGFFEVRNHNSKPSAHLPLI